MKSISFRKILLSFTFVFFAFVLCKNVNANSISKISMDIYVNGNGDANITEVWDCSVNQGTEVYHPYYNLGKSEIKNFRVKDGNKKYTDIGKWNTSGTLSSKAYKSGINNVTNGVELCFGMSSYGKHTYTLNYTITNFVSELKDAQMIYWTLIPHDFSNTIGKAYVKIHTDFNIEDTIDVWGYGDYGGTAYVYNGYIEMSSNGSLSSDEYMTILVKFPLGTFNTSSKISKNFDYYYNLAEGGSVKYNKEGTSVGTFINNSLSFIFNLITCFTCLITFGLIILFFIYFILLVIINSKNKINKQLGNISYYSDLPCNNDIFKIYYLAYEYNLVKNKTDLLGAIILKWIKEKIVRIESSQENGVFLNNKNHVLILDKTSGERFTDEREKKLFDMLYEASTDGVLENDELKAWCKIKYNKILSWFEHILKLERKKCMDNNEIILEERKFLFFKAYEYIYTQEFKEQAMQIAGLKKFLQESTLIKEREAIEVHLFEDYLIIAQILGIAKKVQKQFSDLYPEVIEQSSFTYDNLYFIQTSTASGISVAESSRSEEMARASSYSSGGDGFSSGGGGGGSFGRPEAAEVVSVKIKKLVRYISLISFLVLYR